MLIIIHLGYFNESSKRSGSLAAIMDISTAAVSTQFVEQRIKLVRLIRDIRDKYKNNPKEV